MTFSLFFSFKSWKKEQRGSWQPCRRVANYPSCVFSRNGNAISCPLRPYQVDDGQSHDKLVDTQRHQLTRQYPAAFQKCAPNSRAGRKRNNTAFLLQNPRIKATLNRGHRDHFPGHFRFRYFRFRSPATLTKTFIRILFGLTVKKSSCALATMISTGRRGDVRRCDCPPEMGSMIVQLPVPIVTYWTALSKYARYRWSMTNCMCEVGFFSSAIFSFVENRALFLIIIKRSSRFLFDT